MPIVLAMAMLSYATAASADDSSPTLEHVKQRISEILGISLSAPDDQRTIPASVRTDPRLVDWLRTATEDSEIEVDLGLPGPLVHDAINGFEQVVSVEIRNGRHLYTTLNGHMASTDEIVRDNARMRELLEQDARATDDAFNHQWNALAGVVGDEGVAQILASPSGVGSSRVRRIRVKPNLLRDLLEVLPIDSVEATTTSYDALSTAMAVVGLSAGGSSGFDGAGVAIWQTEVGFPLTTPTSVDASRLTIHNPSCCDDTFHATRMTAILHSVASGVYVHWADQRTGRSTLPGTVVLGNASIAADSPLDADRPYELSTVNEDDFILQHRILMLRGSGNNNGSSGLTWMPVAQGLARNALTVGAVHTPTMTIASFSAHGQPSWSGPKPEIVAPGVMDVPGISDMNIQGVSEATALSTGLASIVHEAYPELENKPAAMKMLLMASAEHIDGVGTNATDAMADREGAGLPSFSNLSNLSAKLMTVSLPATYTAPLTYGMNELWAAGETYRVGVAWLNGGSWASSHGGQAGARWRLRIIPPSGGGSTLTAEHDRRGFQLVEYTPPVSGYYTIEARRIDRRDEDLPVSLAIVVVEK